MLRQLLLICFLLTTSTFAVAETPLRAKIDPLIKPLLKDKLVVGLVVGIVHDGQKHVFGFGKVDKDADAVPDGNTVYEIGSVSKTFTGVLLAEMVLQGKIALDDTLQKHLPVDVKLGVAGKKPILLEHLATHTSGLPRLPTNMQPADVTNPYADYSPERLQAFFNGYQPLAPPGKYAYSNLGMGTVGQVLAQQAKTNYERLLLARICRPLKMRNTRVTLNARLKQQLAPPYDKRLQPNHNWDFDALAGAGGIRSTCHDMLKYVAAHLPDAKHSLTPAMKLAAKKRHEIPGGLAIGLGWHIARDKITMWHNGQTGGYHSYIAFIPAAKLGVVVLSNTATGKIDAVAEQIIRATLGIPETPLAVREEVKVNPKILQRYIGKYALNSAFAIEVTLEKGRLMAQATGQSKFQIYAKSKSKFFYKVVDAQISFVSDGKGKTSRLILHQNGLNQSAKRVK